MLRTTVLAGLLALTSMAQAGTDIVIDNSPEAIEREMEQHGSVTVPLRVMPGCGRAKVFAYSDLQQQLGGEPVLEAPAAFRLVSPGALYEIWTGPARDGKASYSVVLVMLVPAGKAACVVNYGFFPSYPKVAPAMAGA